MGSTRGFQVPIAEGSAFTIDHIPFGVISTTLLPRPRCATAIGEFALDLEKYDNEGHLKELSYELSYAQEIKDVFGHPSLNAFAMLPAMLRRNIRAKIISDLTAGVISESCFYHLSDIKMHLPMQIGDFSDFLTSLEHVQNCAPLTGGIVHENFFSAPSAYNGRVSSIVLSGTPVRRPNGVIWKDSSLTFAPSNALDYELELGFFVSKPVAHGSNLDISNAKDHIFGFVLLNDWSARDIQAFEMPPLGPFNSKGFATTISSWITPLDALDRFTCAGVSTNQEKFKHLGWDEPSTATFDIHLQAHVVRNGKTYKLGKSNLKYLYWTPYQQITHQASAFCGLNTGDLIGTGTISAPGVDDAGKKTGLGSLFEASLAGTKPIIFEDGTAVGFLENGDELVIEGWCGGNEQGKGKIFGLSKCSGKIESTLS